MKTGRVVGGRCRPSSRPRPTKRCEWAIELERELQDSLGEAFAGSVYDERTGRLVVLVSDPAALGKVEAAGADGRLVKYGT